MADIRIQRPIDQPSGNLRLLDELISNLKNHSFSRFRIISAFAKQGPFLKLQPYFDIWRSSGKTLSCILGVDENGTSQEAIEFVRDNFTDSYIARLGKGAFRPTFHPKIYLFESDNEAVAFIGSNNMTVGGLELNAESFIELKMKLPEDQPLLEEVLKCWDDTLSICLPLNQNLLDDLVASKVVISEVDLRAMRATARTRTQAKLTLPPVPMFPAFKVVPPSSYPVPKIAKTGAGVKPAKAPAKQQAQPVKIPTKSSIEKASETFVIQIIPHHNGEVFLSKTAIDQNPTFFGWPFTGKTTPKKTGNPSYPQRDPDPVINLTVFDAHGNAILKFDNFNLNTVFYEPKSEIRITVPPDVVRNVLEYSVMVMQLAMDEGIDYDVYIYNPGSQEFNDYIVACNQTMPSGGKTVARNFGWL